MMMIPCSIKSFYLHSWSKFLKYDIFTEKATFKLVAQELKKEVSLIFSSYFFPIFFSTFSVLITLVAKLSFPLALHTVASNIFCL